MDDAKARTNLSDIAGRHTALKPPGRVKQMGLCPFHKERTPSFEVNDAKGLFHCHGCGASGDHFTILTKLDGLSFRQAFEALTGDTFPAVDPERRAQQRAEDDRDRALAIAEARAFWDAARDIAGTPAETYLRRARGITAPPPPSFRFGMVPAGKDDEGRWKRSYPALIGAVTIADDLVAIQRIFLRDDGADKRWGKKSKLTLGRFVGGAIRMGAADGEPVATESPEDALSIAQELPHLSIWCALGTANLRSLVLPPAVCSITLAGQNDDPGRAAVRLAGDAYEERGITVRAMWPADGYKDWNDMLRGIRA